ncbi:cancer-related nucleoside-triphosphatase homolog [Actinia tenebrosa]|uniref:Cancer-related nucleoside-triphosphatase homolog n=1 Tax=Actinia tenebrosa TaxID=6105 RepID=A0A6P8GZQ3_ACTTE|nr:cancer-related nucleoside-triphosphatase homolog [Actinia tenebrosa]
MASKRHVLLTGSPGVGKTTLCKKIYELLNKKSISAQGFYTEEVRNDRDSGRLGFDVVTLNGERGPLARVKKPGRKQKGPMVGKYLVDLKSFEQLALPTIVPSSTDKPCIVIVDEIGKMELFSKPFAQAVQNLFESPKTCILATVPVARQHPIQLVEQLKGRPDVTLIEVTRANRSSIAEDILALITSASGTEAS